MNVLQAIQKRESARTKIVRCARKMRETRAEYDGLHRTYGVIDPLPDQRPLSSIAADSERAWMGVCAGLDELDALCAIDVDYAKITGEEGEYAGA